MKKFTKAIATSIMIIAILLGSYAPAMATELSQNPESISTLYASKSIRDYSYPYSLTVGKTLTPFTLWTTANTIRYCVNGSGGNVIFRLNNITTGDVRSFTTTANGSWGSITYVTPLDAGTWNITVVYTSGGNHEGMQLEFYK